jgi:DNA topoisomerase-1
MTRAAPVVAASKAALRYSTDQEPGITRERLGDLAIYRDPAGSLIEDPTTLERIRSLVIPPAWSSVWISLDPDAHLQATGRDSRGRKQYRYHPRWRQVRDADKFAHLVDFGLALPRIRRHVATDLALDGLPRRKVLAAVVQLLEVTLIRVGNDEYARENDSYGLTTLTDDHVSFDEAGCRFEFRGKSGVRHSVSLTDSRLAAIVRGCQEIPGQQLFQYFDVDGRRHPVASEHVNAYLDEAAGIDVSAKDFRTWGGTLHASVLLRQMMLGPTQKAIKHQLAEVVAYVALRLGNTPSICRRCYIHPAVLDVAGLSDFGANIEGPLLPAELLLPHGLSASEQYLLSILAIDLESRYRGDKWQE